MMGEGSMYKCNQQSSKNAQKMMISLHENKDLSYVSCDSFI